MKYDILAVDMDGTLLNSQKFISKKNIEAINKALSIGREVVICTGRSVGEMGEFFPLFPQMKYAVTESGTCLYDVKNKKPVKQRFIESDAVEKIIKYAKKRDIMPQIYMNGSPYLSKRDMENLSHFEMEHYYGHFSKNATIVEDAYKACADAGYYAEKICLYHHDTESREETNDYISSLNLPTSVAYSETTSVEYTPVGADKGSALRNLCEYLNIPIELSIAMGDSENDYTMFDVAGLSVAVGNAADHVKKVCKIVTVSNDKDPVAGIIEEYMI